MKLPLLNALMLVALILVGCRQAAPITAEAIQIALDAGSLDVGETTFTVTVQDAAGNPATIESLTVRGDMSHAGMMPVIRDAEGNASGTYDVPFEWTMAGDWLVEVTATLPDGTQALQTFPFTVTGEMDMGDMDDDDDEMPDMAMGGGTSGAYLMITNNRSDDVTLIRASSSVAAMTEIHETSVENDIARMQEQEGGLLIPAGQSILLQPGGLHIMLMNLTSELVEGATTPLVLEFDSGDVIELEAAIANMAPQDGATVEVNGLSAGMAWVRPTAMSEDSMSGMDETDEDTGE